jgi:IMP dehydrogenase
MNKIASFDSVYLIPGYSEIESRHNIDLTPHPSCGSVPFSNPLIASCMDTVTNSHVANIMREAGGTAILHRYATIEDQRNEFLNLHERNRDGTFVAIGATGDWYDRFEALYEAGCRYFCIDVAHGHHKHVGAALAKMQSTYSDLHLMAGNVADRDGFDYLVDHGAKYIRVGVAGGSVCETRNKTGFGLPTLESVIRCAESSRDAVIIADGGIRDSGDIVKALACGADMVILGSLLAGHDVSPGEIISKDGENYKAYRGMASAEAQKNWRGWVSVAEGRKTLVKLKDVSLNETVDTILRGVKSGLSYAGCTSLKNFSSRCRKVFI